MSVLIIDTAKNASTTCIFHIPTYGVCVCAFIQKVFFHQREERALDTALEAIMQRVIDIKGSLQELLGKIEQEGERSDWPSYLNAYSVISAQVI